MLLRSLFAFLLCVGIFCLAQAQVPQTGAGKGTPGGGAARTCTDGAHAAAFNARTSGQNAAHLDANCNFINGLDSDSLYASADLIYLLATDTNTNAKLNIISSSFTITEVNSPVFTTDSGYSVGGTSTANLDTNFNMATNGVTFLQNSASAFAWSLTNFTAGVDYKYMVGTHQSISNIVIYPHSAGNSYFLRINDNSVNLSASILGHFYGVERDIGSPSTTETGYVDGMSQGGAGDTSLAPISFNIILLNDDAGGVNGNPFGGNAAFFWAGGTLGPTQEAKLCHRVNLYLTTIAGAGAGVC